MYSMSMDLIFEVRDVDEGGYCVRALGHPIFTEAQTWEDPVPMFLGQRRFTSKMPPSNLASFNCTT